MKNYKIEVGIGEKYLYNHIEALGFLKYTVEGAIESEEDYIENEELEITEDLETLREIDLTDIYELENYSDMLFNQMVDITEFNMYLWELLDKSSIPYDSSGVSCSKYVYIDDKLIRISDHKVPFGQLNMNRVPDIELVFDDGIVDNELLNKHLELNLEDEIILL